MVRLMVIPSSVENWAHDHSALRGKLSLVGNHYVRVLDAVFRSSLTSVVLHQPGGVSDAFAFHHVGAELKAHAVAFQRAGMKQAGAINGTAVAQQSELGLRRWRD